MSCKIELGREQAKGRTGKRKQGAGKRQNWEQGAGSREKGKLGAGSREQGTWSREQKKGSRELIVGIRSRNNAGRRK